jgi:hypothetical protein
LRLEPRQQPAQQFAVRIVKPGHGKRRARLDDLVAGREDRDAYAPPDRQLAQPQRRRHAQVLRLKPAARGQRDRTAPHVLAGKPPVRAALQSRRHDDSRSIAPHVLLHEHGVGALGHRRAGEDTDRLARVDGLRRSAARGQPVDNRERRLVLRANVRVAHRIAIDRRVVERRQVDRRDHACGKHAGARILQRDRLDFGDRRHALIDQPLDVVDREQRPAEREAIVGELGHQALRTRAITASSGTAFATRISATASASSSDTTGTRAATGPSLAIATMFGSSGASSGLPTAAR